MGTVYQATHVGIDRQVAIKVLHHQHCVREHLVRTFRNEARATSRIGAPNIVEVLDFDELDDGRLLIAMEHIDGAGLDDVMQGEDIGFDRMIPIARQICRGLAAAHAAGITHRDVKPANVMLTTREGRADFVKLVDFGIAAAHTASGCAQPVAGTPEYMAPEAIQHGSVDQRVDQYAFGMLLYQWATGEVPFDGTPEEVLLAQVKQTPVPPGQRTDRPILPSLEALILGCIHKQPEARFPDMNHVEAALCEIQIELGIRTPYDDLPLPRGGRAAPGRSRGANAQASGSLAAIAEAVARRVGRGRAPLVLRGGVGPVRDRRRDGRASGGR